MKRKWLKLFSLLLILSAFLGSRLLLMDFLDFHHLNRHKEQLIAFVAGHYLEAVFAFIALYIGTALFLPGALLLTLAGGMMFGTLPTVVYANVGATTGAVLAFLCGRKLFGEWIQEHFQRELRRLNDELSRHGMNYLLVLRFLPIAPFFVINYCAGITRIPLRTFLWTTSLGIIPGSFAYAFLGHQLRKVKAVADLFSWKIMIALLILSLLALLPVVLHHLPDRGIADDDRH